jgi:hypothetical protein
MRTNNTSQCQDVIVNSAKSVSTGKVFELIEQGQLDLDTDLPRHMLIIINT